MYLILILYLLFFMDYIPIYECVCVVYALTMNNDYLAYRYHRPMLSYLKKSKHIKAT